MIKILARTLHGCTMQGKRRLSSFLVVASLLAAAAPSVQAMAGAGVPVRVDAVQVQLVAEQAAVVPGQPLSLGLRIAHDPQWHTYWRNPGDSGLPTTLTFSGLPAGFEAGQLQWPAPSRLFIPPLANYGYEGEVVLPLSLTVPAQVEGDRLALRAKADWLVCRELCIPGQADLALDLPVVRNGVSAPPVDGSIRKLFAQARSNMPVEALDATVSARDGTLLLVVDRPLRQMEFFPLAEGHIQNAAAQQLFAPSDTDGAAPVRLEVRLSDEAARDIDSGERLRAAGQGVVLADGQPYTLRLQVPPAGGVTTPLTGTATLATGSGDAFFTGGVRIARVAGADEQPPAGSQGQSGSFSVGRSGASAFSLPGTTGGAASAWGSSAGSAAGATAGGSGLAASGVSGSGLWGTADGVTGGASTALLALVFAMLGGLLLNLMPCVFPVIGLKVLAFARHGQAGGDVAQIANARRASRAGALAFAVGVIATFVVLGLLLVVLRAGGQAVGWGFQLQSPVFVSAMALLFVAIGLNLSGLFEFGLAMTRLANLQRPSMGGSQAPEGPERGGVRGAFLSGALAVLVATPCTAPFMGSALGYTLTSGAVHTLGIFAALGFGMALPYLLLGLFPAWLRWLPRPGRWMETFRQLLAFPMYLAAAWLAWVLGRQQGVDAMLALAVAVVLLAFSAWVYGRFVQRAQPVRVGPIIARQRRRLAGGLALVSLLLAGWMAWPGDSEHAQAAVDLPTAGVAASDSTLPTAAWATWSEEAVETARARGRPVFVDFTAAWCVSCQANKKLVLERASVRQALDDAGVITLRADWTRQDPAITAELARHGRSGVPLYLLYHPKVAQPLILPELLSTGYVLEALAALR